MYARERESKSRRKKEKPSKIDKRRLIYVENQRKLLKEKVWTNSKSVRRTNKKKVKKIKEKPNKEKKNENKANNPAIDKVIVNIDKLVIAYTKEGQKRKRYRKQEQ